MKIDTNFKINFIENELYHELRCLLGAATLWEHSKSTHAGFETILAEDSAFVHARNV